MGGRKAIGRRILPIVVFLAGLGLVVFASVSLWAGWAEDAAARGEYDSLREQMTAATEGDTHTDPPSGARVDMSYFTAINPDFVGWLSIAGMPISYPVVQGEDNAHYLHTTFRGEQNPAGAVFMDYRARQCFVSPVTILYGHNMRDGSMFGALIDYLDADFLREHPRLTIITADGDTLVYEVFYARRAGAWDDVYALDFNDAAQAAEFFATAPSGASRFLVLSTCEGGNDRNSRVVVYAALMEGV